MILSMTRQEKGDLLIQVNA